MATETSRWINFISEDQIPSAELILPTTPNATYFEQNAIVGIMNNYGSDSIVRIKEIQINELIARTTTALTNLNLYLTTAVVSGQTVTITPFDSSTSIPSQVSAVKYPASVTTTGGILRNILPLTGLSMTGALGAHQGFRGSLKSGGLNLNSRISGYNSETQNLTLREGQGIVLRTSLTAPQNYPMELIVQFSDGTNTFIVSEVVNHQSVTELFSLFNGVGSGVVLQIARIELRQLRTADLYRVFSIESCSEIYDGKTISVNSMDSSFSAIDSLVEFKQNCTIRQGNVDANQGRNARAGGDFLPWRKLVEPAFGVGVALASGLLTLRPRINKAISIDRTNNVGEIVLREGEGLALLQRNYFAGWGNYEINVLFTIEDNGGAVVGGETSYVF
jgi:hypothetical protein